MKKNNFHIAQPRTFAIVPAAGGSTRMGQPKLLMPWGDSTVIDCVLRAWTRSNVDHALVVMRKDDEALRTVCQRWPVTLVRPTQNPKDMKASVQAALNQIELRHAPAASDRCFIAPADLPTLSYELINRLLRSSSNSDAIIVPHFGDKQGHPVVLPWHIVQKISNLGESQGIDQLIEQHRTKSVTFPAESRLLDIDTLQDYKRLKNAVDLT